MSPETSSNAAICSTCRRPLVQPGPNGECVRCLFGVAMLADDPSANDAVGVVHAADPEQSTRYGQFEILAAGDGSPAELGAGAMGTTYRARDGVLHRVVALKVISRSYAGDPATRARFLHEARSAARLRHPHVASVFHYGEQDGQCYYAMELVDGETLEQRVRRAGPLPAATALEIAAQVARALAAAEAEGIVHRDLKPSNVMLATTGGEAGPNADEPLAVKVIDFGLAKAVSADAAARGPGDTRGGFVGTPAFASPEQFARNDDERIDTRSDIYSLGVTLWYLLCGKLPFVGQTLTEIHQQQVGQPLPLDQLRAVRTPGCVVDLLRAMLAVSPVHRPQSARELLDAIRRCQHRLLAASRSRYARLAGFLGALALVVVAIALWREHTRPATPPPDRSLAVLPFEDLDHDPGEAYFAAATQSVVTGNLARIKDIRVVGADSTRAYPPDGRDLRAIRRELGVQFLLEGKVQQENGQSQVSIRLVNVQDGSRFWERQYRHPSTDLFLIYQEITLDVANQLQAALSRDERAAISQPPTSDPVAYDLYLRVYGDARFFTGDDEYRQHLQKCAAVLEEATARDPRFMLAYCELTTVYSELAFRTADAPPEQRTVDYRRLAQEALQRAEKLQPDAGEVHLARANRFLKIDHNVEAARVECDLARRTLPNSAGVEFVAGRVARRQNRWEDAVRSLERAAALEPRDVDILQYLEETYLALRRYADFDRTVHRIIPLASAQERGGASLETTLSAVEGRADLEPLRHLRATQTADDGPGGEAKELADLEVAVLGRDPDAILRVLAASGREYVSQRGVRYPNAFFEGLAARLRGDAAAAHAAFTRSRSEVAQAALSGLDDGRRLSLLALIDAGLGRTEDAVREARRACELMMPYEKFALESPGVRSNLATVYAWTGQPDLALAELAAIVDGPAGGSFLINQPTYGDFRLSPFWDPLRGDPRFETLVQHLQRTTAP